MSQRHDQTLANLTYELTHLAAENLAFYRRLHKLRPDLVDVTDVSVSEKRLQRLRTMLTLLQKQAKEG